MSGATTPGSKESIGRDIATRVRTPVESPSDNYDRTNADGDNVSIDWASGDVSRGSSYAICGPIAIQVKT